MIFLVGAGVVTSLPLLWFTNAGKKLRYTTMGFIQYMTPSIQLINWCVSFPRTIHFNSQHHVRTDLDGVGNIFNQFSICTETFIN